MSGLTPTGFDKKTLSEILAEVQAEQRATISPKLGLLATNVFGQINGIICDKLRELWDLAEAVYRAMYPDSASDESLDNVSAMTGAVRLSATKSQVELDQLFLDNGTTVPVGSVVGVGADGPRFVLTEAVTNSLGYPATFSAAAEAEETGPEVGLAGTIDEIKTPISGWNAQAAITCANAENYTVSGGPLALNFKVDRGSTQSPTVSDGTYTAAQMATALNAGTTGGTFYAAGTKLRFASDTDGEGSAVEITGGALNAVLGFATTEIKGFNSLDADLGRDLETDVELRLRRVELLQLSGSATVEAIASEIRSVADVEQVTVLENETDITDPVTGLPPHSVEALVLGGDDQDVAEAIFASKAAGIATYGSTSKTVTDSQGIDHTIKFSRPTTVNIYIDLTVFTDGDFPATGSDLIKAALVAEGADQLVGEDVIALRYKAVPLDIAGVVDVTAFKIDTVTPPVGTGNITMTVRQLAAFDTSRISVTVT